MHDCRQRVHFIKSRMAWIEHKDSGKVRQRFAAWQLNRVPAPVACLVLLTVYAVLMLSVIPWVSHLTGGRSLTAAFRSGLLQPSDCSAYPANWAVHSSSAALDCHSRPPAAAPVSPPVQEAVVHALLSVHAAAEQSLQLAAAIWHSKGQSDINTDLQPCLHEKHNKHSLNLAAPKQQQSTAAAAAVAAAAAATAAAPKKQQASRTGPAGPEVAPVVTHLNLSAILSGVGDYPAGSSSGRGIVVVGGGPKYTPAAFGCVYFIRRTGSQLPIEVWAPPHEPIHPAVAADFTAMGNVSVRNLRDVFPSAAHALMRERRYLAKQLAILASQFQEVLFLDADNIPLRDPTFLFDEPLYRQHGLLMWPDFWSSEVKPGAWVALEIPPELRPPGSHESGQVVIDKRRAWKPLLLAIYLNMRGDVFYTLFSKTGMGDKETLPFAWLALGYGKYGLVQHDVLSLGYMAPDDFFIEKAMLQRGPDGIPMFLHAHAPKISVPKRHIKLPPAGRRQWDVLTGQITAFPEGLDVARLKDKRRSYEVLNAVAGYDLEVEALQLQRYLRCQPAWVACCLR